MGYSERHRCPRARILWDVGRTRLRRAGKSGGTTRSDTVNDFWQRRGHVAGETGFILAARTGAAVFQRYNFRRGGGEGRGGEAQKVEREQLVLFNRTTRPPNAAVVCPRWRLLVSERAKREPLQPTRKKRGRSYPALQC